MSRIIVDLVIARLDYANIVLRVDKIVQIHVVIIQEQTIVALV